jgi:hypothetical protein
MYAKGKGVPENDKEAVSGIEKLLSKDMKALRVT